MAEFIRNIRVVAGKEYREQRKKGLPLLIMIFMMTVWIVNLVFITKNIRDMGISDATTIPLVLNSLFTHQALSFFLIFSFMFLISLFYKEKQSRTIECLFVTPLSVRTIWIGKSVFMFLGGISFAYMAAFIGIIAVNAFLRPETGFIYPSAPSLFFFFFLFPILAFVLCALLGLIHLISSGPTVSSSLFLLIGMGYLGITSAKMKSMAVGWTTAWYYLVFTIILLIIVLVAARSLTKEKVILSDK